MRPLSDTDYWLFQDNLTLDDMKMIGIVSFAALSVATFFGVAMFKDSRRRAWCLSLLNSFVLSVLSLWYVSTYLIPTYPGLLRFQPDVTMFHGRSNIGMASLIWFATANILDLVYGLIFYRDKLDMLTTFVHHPVFIWMSYFCATGDGFFTHCRPFMPAYLTLYIIEVPTFLLALGSVFPPLRTDLGFGVTFFIFRILAHGYMMALATISNTDTPIWFCYIGPFMLHVFWFSSWLSKYGRPNKGGKRGQKGSEVGATGKKD